MIQNIFEKQLGQVQEKIGQPEDTVDEKKNSTEDIKEEWPIDKTPNYDGRARRDGDTPTITTLASEGQ